MADERREDLKKNVGREELWFLFCMCYICGFNDIPHWGGVDNIRHVLMRRRGEVLVMVERNIFCKLNTPMLLLFMGGVCVN